MLKLSDATQAQHPDLLKRLTGGKHFGIPFHTIFDAEGKMVIDSEGPRGNIGCPSGFEGKRHLRRMLEAGCRHLSGVEIEQIVSSASD